jgi:hypothetical protein
MRCRSRTFTGAGLAAVAVAAVLTLSGCSGDSDDNGTEQPSAGTSASAAGGQHSATASPSGTPTDSASASASGSATPSSTASGDETKSAAGVWLSTQGGAKVQLVLGEGKAGLTSTHLCGGTYTGQDTINLTMTCMDGDRERTTGQGELAADGKTLVVEWKDGPTDTFSRTGLPSN